MKLLCLGRPLECSENCKTGDAKMCHQLGEIFARGSKELAQNPEKASAFKRRACDLDPSVHPDCSKLATEAQINLDETPDPVLEATPPETTHDAGPK